MLTFQTAYAKVLKVEKNRTVEIFGPINDLEYESKELIRMGNNSKNPVFVVIDSPGGSVIAGVKFIQAIDRVRSRGVPVYCAVTGMAMSMATHILAACSYRYALPTSLIMWHPMAISVMMARLTEKSSGQLNKQFKLLSKYLDERLKKALQISEEKYREYEEGEYIMFGYDLNNKVAPKFLRLVSDIRTR